MSTTPTAAAPARSAQAGIAAARGLLLALLAADVALIALSVTGVLPTRAGIRASAFLVIGLPLLWMLSRPETPAAPLTAPTLPPPVTTADYVRRRSALDEAVRGHLMRGAAIIVAWIFVPCAAMVLTDAVRRWPWTDRALMANVAAAVVLGPILMMRAARRSERRLQFVCPGCEASLLGGVTVAHYEQVRRTRRCPRCQREVLQPSGPRPMAPDRA